jgi:uncharacterized protein
MPVPVMRLLATMVHRGVRRCIVVELRMDRVVVSGASSGIGAAFARRLGRDAAMVTLVGRDRSRLAEVASEVSAAGADIETVVADLSEGAALEELEGRLAGSPCDLLVNAAGLAHHQPFVEADPDLALRQVQVNVLALVRLTRAVLPGMVSAGHGGIINVSSLMAFDDRPGWSIYVATKAFVMRFTENLALELAGSGVAVQALSAGPVASTEFFNRAGFDASVFPEAVVMPAADVVRASLAGLARAEVICVPGLEDAAEIEAHHSARLRVLMQGRRGTLAARYG